MASWETEPLDKIMNHGLFSITLPGPLHAPIQNFSIRRNDKLELVLETHCPADAKSAAVDRSAGTVRINIDEIELTNISGIKARAVGVQPHHATTSFNHRTGVHGLREEAAVQCVEAILRDDASPQYTIDWLENVDGRDFIWPDGFKDRKDVGDTRTLGNIDRLVLTSAEEHNSFTRSSVFFLLDPSMRISVLLGAGPKKTG
jgi:hypothetical protein